MSEALREKRHAPPLGSVRSRESCDQPMTWTLGSRDVHAFMRSPSVSDTTRRRARTGMFLAPSTYARAREHFKPASGSGGGKQPSPRLARRGLRPPVPGRGGAPTTEPETRASCSSRPAPSRGAPATRAHLSRARSSFPARAPTSFPGFGSTCPSFLYPLDHRQDAPDYTRGKWPRHAGNPTHGEGATTA
jgi:hypothetical protein